MVDGDATEIIGILPQDFRFMNSSAAVIIPMQLDRAKVIVGNFSYRAIARLKPGATLAQANADVARMLPIFTQVALACTADPSGRIGKSFLSSVKSMEPFDAGLASAYNVSFSFKPVFATVRSYASLSCSSWLRVILNLSANRCWSMTCSPVTS